MKVRELIARLLAAGAFEAEVSFVTSQVINPEDALDVIISGDEFEIQIEIVTE